MSIEVSYCGVNTSEPSPLDALVVVEPRRATDREPEPPPQPQPQPQPQPAISMVTATRAIGRASACSPLARRSAMLGLGGTTPPRRDLSRNG